MSRAFDFSDSKMVAIINLAGYPASREEISAWLKKEEDPAGREMSDIRLAMFLNGLISEKRGKREGPAPQPEERLTNNIILRKIKIALDLKDDDILAVMSLADAPLSRHELSAFFRKPGHRNYRECKDQILRNFLKGVQLKYRPEI